MRPLYDVVICEAGDSQNDIYTTSKYIEPFLVRQKKIVVICEKILGNL